MHVVEQTLIEVAPEVPKLLSKAEIVEISGPDTVSFSHAQFCNDVQALVDFQWQLGAWLDAQGRARFVFMLLRVQPDRLLAWLPRGNAQTFASELQRFVFRAKVRIRALSGFHLLMGESLELSDNRVTAIQDGWEFTLPGPSPRTARLCVDTPGLTFDELALEEWNQADVAVGLPWLEESLGGQFTPQALGLDRLGATSVDKGCYPGQEIVARLHFRGGNKRACWRIHGDSGTAPKPGHSLIESSTGLTVGTVLYAATLQPTGFKALAVLPNSLQSGAGLQLEREPGVRLALISPMQTEET